MSRKLFEMFLADMLDERGPRTAALSLKKKKKKKKKGSTMGSLRGPFPPGSGAVIGWTVRAEVASRLASTQGGNAP